MEWRRHAVLIGTVCRTNGSASALTVDMLQFYMQFYSCRQRTAPMNAIVIEHVDVDELPEAWRARLAAESEAQRSGHVTVRIEAETGIEEQAAASPADDSLSGMWSDREDMRDVAGYIRAIRAPRFTDNSAPSEG
jgi:hypothetical protein